jgi:flagellar hook-associated protein 1 FlgK
VQDATTANQTLKTIGGLSDQIIKAQARGESTADLENQRDAQMRSLTELTGARFVKKPDGDLIAYAGNTELPLRASSGPFSLGNANIGAGTPQSAIPQLMLNGAAVSGIGGRIGANLTLRDTTVPSMQAGLDGFSQALASGFSAQGLALFTDGSGAVPASGPAAAGFSATIQVSSAVAAAPSMTRDGTAAAGAAGSTTLIDNVLTNVFASGSGSLTGQVTDLISGYATQAANAASTADTSTALRTSLDSKLSAETGVSVDSEMTFMLGLQSAYAANAKIVQATQELWTQTLEMVQ